MVTQDDIASINEVKRFLTAIIRGSITDVLSWTTDGLVFTKSSEEMDPDTVLLIKRVKVTKRTSTRGDWTETRTVVELHDALKAAELMGQALGMFKTNIDATAHPAIPVNYEDWRKRLGLDPE